MVDQNIGETAHRTSVRDASNKLFSESQGAMDNPNVRETLTPAQIQIGEQATKAMVDNGLLPGVTLTYAEKNFSQLSANGKDINIDDLRPTDYAAGSIDRSLVDNLRSYMKAEGKTHLSKDEVTTLLNKFDENYHEGDRKNAEKVAKTLQGKGGDNALLDAIDLAGKSNRDDGIISKDDVGEYLRNRNTGNGKLTEDTQATLQWLKDNWDSKEVKALQNENGHIDARSLNRYMALQNADT